MSTCQCPVWGWLAEMVQQLGYHSNVLLKTFGLHPRTDDLLPKNCIINTEYQSVDKVYPITLVLQMLHVSMHHLCYSSVAWMPQMTLPLLLHSPIMTLLYITMTTIHTHTHTFHFCPSVSFCKSLTSLNSSPSLQ